MSFKENEEILTADGPRSQGRKFIPVGAFFSEMIVKGNFGMKKRPRRLSLLEAVFEGSRSENGDGPIFLLHLNTEPKK